MYKCASKWLVTVQAIVLHIPSRSSTRLWQLWLQQQAAGFTEYAGEVVSVEVEGWRDVGGGVWGDWPRVTALQFLGPVQASRPNRHLKEPMLVRAEGH